MTTTGTNGQRLWFHNPGLRRHLPGGHKDPTPPPTSDAPDPITETVKDVTETVTGTVEKVPDLPLIGDN